MNCALSLSLSLRQINTNARSLCPKINSLIDSIEELDAALAIVTETWLADGTTLEEDKQDLLLGAGLSMICKNRRPDTRGLSYGGVAIIYKDDLVNFKELKIYNPDNYEVVAAVGSVQGITRKIATIACYMPPNLTVARARGCLDFLEQLVIEMKRRLKDPYILVAGDFNQWKLEDALQEFRDLFETDAGPTMGDRNIDRVFSNLENITEARTLAPLQTDGNDGHLRESDHRLLYLTARLPRKEKYKWLSYSYRYNNPDSAKSFGDWLVTKDWSDVVQTNGSDNKASAYQLEINKAIEQFFPLRTIKRRNIDPPWINARIKKLIRSRKRIFKETGGRSAEWKRMKKRIQDLIDKRCKKYQESQKLVLLKEDAARDFFKQTKNYMSKQRPTPFDPMNMFPGLSEQQVADLLAVHFNSISNEFSPLDHHTDIPYTYNKDLPILTVPEVAIRLRKFKKPRSMVRGDIFPDLVTKFADFLAVPLTDIFNEITRTSTWPRIWKDESVTIIPKTRTPTDIGELRNISCTMLASKVYESYVLSWALEEVNLKPNQFRGMKGCSASHMLVSVWQNVLTDLEDCRASTLLTAIDYAKAFNRMQFQECLRSFARHCASNAIIKLIATFLTDRHMSVRVGSSWSKRLPVHGGVPQGSILGVLLFNITTDNLEDEQHAIGYDQTTAYKAGDSGRQGSELSPNRSPPITNPSWDSSTPAGPSQNFEPGITPFRSGGNAFVFLDQARNVRRALDLDPDLTMLRDKTLPPEPNPSTSAIWTPRPTEKHKYIDDGILDTKLNMETVDTDQDGTRTKHAVCAQNMFRRTIRNAELIGMKENTQKTNLLCISDAISFKAAAVIYTESGEKLVSKDELKVLGFRFGRRPNCTAHVEGIRRSFRGRYWLLIHLKQHHFTEDELLVAYRSIIRPIAEYCSVVFHSMLTDQQDEQIERLQSTALRYIYGLGMTYEQMRQKSGLQTLRNRRVAACDKFAAACASSPRFCHWFPENIGRRRSSRHHAPYLEQYARCDRLKNSPIFYMRRRLNGKPGKQYGARNAKYRNA